ncbi:long-chain-fatty-acid-CoA ligase [Vibrio ishigakensis]|uniref:Long-chain-fatty-acid-CoA ligase n=1 Tax=Vibrio ishigakensis TaxID=1481914 RepID=A0A0B8QN94_9VIBR|nr:long-chain-fatty-acid-CoA ligase [Vibrio ishigakensis]
MALKFAQSLREMGLQPRDKVAFISKNCVEWFITDLALMLGDYISVPVFPTAGLILSITVSNTVKVRFSLRVNWMTLQPPLK